MNKVNFKSIEAFSLVELSSAEISEINGGERTAGDVVEDIGYTVGKMVGGFMNLTKRVMEGMLGI